MPVGAPRASRRISKTENGRRSSGSMPRRRLDHHELAGRARRARSRARRARARCSRATAAVGDHRGVDVDGHRSSIAIGERSTSARSADDSRALPADAHRTRWSRARWRPRYLRRRSCCSSTRAAAATSAAWSPLAATLAACYGVHLAVVFYALIVLAPAARDRSASRPAGSASASCLAVRAAPRWRGASLMWLNLRGFRAVARRRTRRAAWPLGAAALTACAVAARRARVAAALGRPARRAVRGGASPWSSLIVASLALPLCSRGPADARRRSARVGSTSAPSFAAARSSRARRSCSRRRRVARLHLAGGGRGPAAELRPPARRAARRCTWRRCGRRSPSPVWTAVATGQAAVQERRALGGARIARGDRAGADRPAARLLLRARAGAFGFLVGGAADRRRRCGRGRSGASSAAPGIAVGVVGWPLTYPAQPVHGIVVSDQFHLRRRPPLELDDPPATYPADARERCTRGRPAGRAGRGARARTAAGATPYAGAAPRSRSIGCTTRVADAARRAQPAPLARRCATRASTRSGHYFLRLRDAARVRRRHRRRAPRRTGRVLEQYYALRRRRDRPRDRSRSAPTICCWSCRGSAWSRSAPASACSSARSATPD